MTEHLLSKVSNTYTREPTITVFNIFSKLISFMVEKELAYNLTDNVKIDVSCYLQLDIQPFSLQ